MSVVYASKVTQSVSRYDNMVLNVFPLPVRGLYMSCMSAGYKSGSKPIQMCVEGRMAGPDL